VVALGKIACKGNFQLDWLDWFSSGIGTGNRSVLLTTSFLSLPSQSRKISFKIINLPTLLLPHWREVTASTPFENCILPRDVATRWNSTYDMLKAFLEMKNLVAKFMDSSLNGLLDYILSDEDWDAVNDLVSALKVRLIFLLLRLANMCLDFEGRD